MNTATTDIQLLAWLTSHMARTIRVTVVSNHYTYHNLAYDLPIGEIHVDLDNRIVSGWVDLLLGSSISEAIVAPWVDRLEYVDVDYPAIAGPHQPTVDDPLHADPRWPCGPVALYDPLEQNRPNWA